MRISWIHDELDSELREESEDRIFKPAWRLAEGFEKSHGLQCRNKADRASALDEHTLVRCEEINFHKIAIRYSANLSKDCVFSCLRHIFHRIGKTMATGQEVRVFCGCGDFVAKERKADFVFDTHYHRFVVRALPPQSGASRAVSARPPATPRSTTRSQSPRTRELSPQRRGLTARGAVEQGTGLPGGGGRAGRGAGGGGVSEQLILEEEPETETASGSGPGGEGDAAAATDAGGDAGAGGRGADGDGCGEGGGVGAAKPGGKGAEFAEEGQGAPTFYNGVAHDESWRLARVRRMDRRREAVAQRMWEEKQARQQQQATAAMKYALAHRRC